MAPVQQVSMCNHNEIDDTIGTEINLMERQVNIEEIKKRIMKLNLANGNVMNSHDKSGNCDRQDNLKGPEGKVLVLYTGGTIGMVRNEIGALAPIPNIFVDTVKNYPYLHDRAYADKELNNSGSLVLPITGTDNRRIIYDVLEYSPLLDSSNMTMDNWIRIANDIRNSYEDFDGFVVLHGTDTLSYTASALSFMLEALGKTVVITGSQLPIFDSRSDGLSNFLTSLVIAGNHNIPEVCVFFGTQLMRGNRTSKVASASFEAFASPNCSALAIAGIKIEVNYHSIFRQSALEKFHVHKVLNRNVGLLRIFPSITADLVRAFVQPPTAGVVLQTYGAGNIPANREDIIEVLREASKRGVIIVSITQCSKGGVTDLYESGKLLLEVGITPGSDMTPEAALTKLAYVLSKTDWDINTKRHMMRSNLRGELTTCSVNGQFCQVEDSDLVKTVSLRGDGVDVSQPNGDGRTILHLACCEGDLKIVRTLLEMGANVHIKDRFNRTPLTEAVENNFHEIIKLLLQCGAHLHESSLVLGEKLCSAAACGNLKRLQSLHIAGANLSLSDSSGRTALHHAALHDRTATAQFLLEHGADLKHVDLLGHTPYALAQISGAKNIMKILDIASNVSNSKQFKNIA
ncbi:hypothetical protein PV327_000271 [Microctonus hyperodae]|uniref:asparaginase n=1 Tax=Microctonus hyperodae TaxID=165561 RepID=A0AA39G5U5_MICHY|nr:hypothetical protein PV327_000271 [Microctonus hyperodae]